MPRSCTNTQLLVCCRSVYTRAFMFQAENFKYIEIHAKYTKSKSHTLYWLHITITADKCNLFLLICQWWRDCGSKVGRKKSFALWLLFSGSNARPRFFWRQCQASHFCCCQRFYCRFLPPEVCMAYSRLKLLPETWRYWCFGLEWTLHFTPICVWYNTGVTKIRL